jgi:F-type H+-transporting ATPase subunit epsilon
MAEHTPFHVTIANVAGALFEGNATSVSVPSVDGVTVVLAHHEPLIALLKKGTVSVTDNEGKKSEYAIEAGVLEVSHNKAIVLV